LQRRELTKVEQKKIANLGVWTKERVVEDAKKYTSKIQWLNANASAYQTAVLKGWVTEATADMIRPEYKPYPKGYWSKERVLEDAKKYGNSTIWRTSSRLAYRNAREKGWFAEATAHMIKIQS